ncbi:MAG: phosphoribosylamine--glycine ligase [bacterium]
MSKMKVLVVGGGGREHALVWKISRSERVDKVLCLPGNAGIAEEAECLPGSAEDIKSVSRAALKEDVDLVVIGPEAPLTMGLADRLREMDIKVFGCSRAAAELEGSKVFAKLIMDKYKIPTAGFKVCAEYEEARQVVEASSGELVVKADGLAAGKGVMVCNGRDEAMQALDTILRERAFGDAGNRVVIEEKLEGEEASFLAFTDGEHVLPLASSQDHKAIYDGDQGPNTGGMGAYSPAAVVTDDMHRRIMDEVMKPTVKAMQDMGRTYQGVLYAGLMITAEGPRVLEFNARFGDPEAQPLLFRMKSDLVDFLEACASADGSLRHMRIEWDDPAVCVVMAAEGYPGKYEKGFEIKGLEDARELPHTMVFQAGTDIKDGRIVTSGGRVLGVTAKGADIKKAIENAYRAVEKISWQGAYYRTDIGKRALQR